MTGLEFMKEEYLALRKEVEAFVSELATLEGEVGINGFNDERYVLLIRHGLLQSSDAVQFEPVEGLRHLSQSKVHE